MAQENQTMPTTYRGPVQRLRVVVANDQWKVEKTVAVKRMTLPASWTPDDTSELRRATYYEVIGRKGVVYRRRIPDPTDTSVEVFERGRISRIDTNRDMRIELLVPDGEPIDRVRLVVGGRDLPLRDGKKKPNRDGYRPPDSDGKRGG